MESLYSSRVWETMFCSWVTWHCFLCLLHISQISVIGIQFISTFIFQLESISSFKTYNVKDGNFHRHCCGGTPPFKEQPFTFWIQPPFQWD